VSEQPYSVKKLSWRSVISDVFHVLAVHKDMPLRTFRKENHIGSKVGNIFLELDTFIEEGGAIIDVVLMSKVWWHIQQ
jgi:hypothetical protein